ncbi:hypothetical protein BOTBODRAFT_187542 [Botryobasidium botryosum FD-172 SS1]|uniref:Succinate dehydrogenase [ubiquinone] cytochrome b small subunit n=1 Tax=Botryobasidium botryosum (strain FD-172 SS1) TaxID=930990 RepID=A0A067MU94_BOTB1|nr:hypothetical protein BOTBODRAFT_187542 [Botryobasidium botryosum FD-172 SS1]
MATVSTHAFRRLAAVHGNRPLALAAARFHSGRPSHVAKSPAPRKDTPTYVPGGPILLGTVNDPTTFPPPSKSDGSHHWAFERLLSATLVPLTVSSFVLSSSPYPVLDGLLAVSLVVHSHLGFDQIVVDYLHPRKFPILGRISAWGLRLLTVGTLVGVYQFNTEDVGLTELIKRVWQA